MTSIKEQPRAAGKGEMYKLLYPINEKEIRREALRIITEKRKVTLDEARKKRVLRENEVIALMRHFGVLD